MATSDAMGSRDDAARQKKIDQAVQSIQTERGSPNHTTSSDYQIAALKSRVKELEDSIERLHKMTTTTTADFYRRIRLLETSTERLPGLFNEFRAVQNDVDWIKKSAEFGRVILPDDPAEANRRQ